MSERSLVSESKSGEDGLITPVRGIRNGTEDEQQARRRAGSSGDYGQRVDSRAKLALQAAVDNLQVKAQGSFREEARLEATTPCAPAAPATLPPSSKTSQSSEDSSDEIAREGTPSALSRAAQQISAVSQISLPGSPEDDACSAAPAGGEGRRWETGEQSIHGGRHPTAELMAAIPESSDYVYEEVELNKMEQSPAFLAETEKDPKFTLLHYVAMLGHGRLQEALASELMSRHPWYSRLAKCLVRHRGKSVYEQDKYGCTPLQLAASCNNTEMVKVLLEPYGFEASGKEVLALDGDGYNYLNHQDDQINFSALHGAVSHSAFDAVILLLKYGANPLALDVTRKTAFEVAPSLVSLQELLRLVVQREDEVPRSVIVQLMAVVLDKQLKEGTPQQNAPASPAGAGGARGSTGAGIPDARANRSFVAQQRWSKAARSVTAALQAPQDPEMRFTSAVLETIGNMQNADVGSTIARHFGQLYKSKRYGVLVEYVILAINANQYNLTEMMIDRICNDCPDVLANSKWHETLEPLVSTYPTLFHRLLFKLQEMRDEDVCGFVRCLRPSTLQAGTGPEQRPQSAPPPPPPQMSMIAGISVRHLGPGAKSHAVDRVKLLIYQQLVEGLRKVNYRIVKTFIEESAQELLNDMAQFPVFAEFVGLVANLHAATAVHESDSMRRALLELLRPPRPSRISAAANTAAAAAALNNAAAAGLTGTRPGTALRPSTSIGLRQSKEVSAVLECVPSAPRPSDAPPITTAWDSDGSRKIIIKDSAKVSFALNAHGENLSFGTSSCCGITGSGRGSPGGASSSGGGANSGGAPRGGGGGGSQPVAESLFGGCWEQSDAVDPYVVSADTDTAARRRMRLSLQTLDVERVLWAAVKAGKAYNVETAVTSIVSWVDVNSRDGKGVFLVGVTADLIQDMAMRFPSACASLLNLVSKDVLEQLDTLQVSAKMLYGKDHLVKCSHVRNHFTWREQELRKLMSAHKGYSQHVVDALVDYGVPFECVYKAAVEMGSTQEDYATPEEFAALIEHGFTGPELKQLISNGIRLAKVIGYIDECAKDPPGGVSHDFVHQLDVAMPVLLKDMLREKLSPRIVDVILREGKMFETTKYNNFRPGRPLRKMYPEKLFVPCYTHHFVQMLLICWQRGIKDGKPVLKPWSKDFIDTVFEPNDPLCTKLKSAFDNKLTDTQVYIQGDNQADAAPLEPKSSAWLGDQQRERRESDGEEQLKLIRIRQLLRIFVGNGLLVHRWPVFLAAHVGVFVHGAVHTYFDRIADLYVRWRSQRHGKQMSLGKKARCGTIDAAVLAFPILGLVQPDGGDILTALVHADAPSAWFNYGIVRALYGLHWTSFGRVMVYLGAAVQLQFASVFLVFFLLVINYPPVSEFGEEGLDNMRHLPIIQGMLCTSMVLSASMLIERFQELRVPQLGSWVSFGRHLELCCHAMVWTVAGIVWSGRCGSLVPALSGLTMLLFVARLTLFGLVTEKLSTAVLALLEILSDSRYFFLLIALVYGGFVLAVAGLRAQLMASDGSTESGGSAPSSAAQYTSALFTVLLGDFQSSQLTDERGVWRFPDFSVILLSIYALLMMIVFMNLLIATMNDTYDRVKEFREVEVMRLRSHMMVFVKDFIKHNAKKKLEHLDGEVLHLLLRPEEVKSGRWLSQSGSEPSEYSAWAGRITYMRSTIVREVEAAVEALVTQQADKTRESLAAIEKRLDKVESAGAAKAAAAAGQGAAGPAGGGGGGGGGADAAAPAATAAPASAERLEKMEQQLQGLQAGLDALLARNTAPTSAAATAAS